MSLHVALSSNVLCMNCVHVHENIYDYSFSRNWYASIAQNVNEYLTYIYHVQEEINMTQSSELKSHQTIWFPDKSLNGSPGTLLAIQVRNKRCKRVVYTRHTVNLLKNPPQVLRFWFWVDTSVSKHKVYLVSMVKAHRSSKNFHASAHSRSILQNVVATLNLFFSCLLRLLFKNLRGSTLWRIAVTTNYTLHHPSSLDAASWVWFLAGLVVSKRLSSQAEIIVEKWEGLENEKTSAEDQPMVADQALSLHLRETWTKDPTEHAMTFVPQRTQVSCYEYWQVQVLSEWNEKACSIWLFWNDMFKLWKSWAVFKTYMDIYIYINI